MITVSTTTVHIHTHAFEFVCYLLPPSIYQNSLPVEVVIVWHGRMGQPFFVRRGPATSLAIDVER